jgi:uncharacterized protein with HEPN domain
MPYSDQELAALWDVWKAARTLERVLDAAEPRSFEDNEVMRLALQKATENLGEAARRMPPSLRASFPQIPWRVLIAQRNVLAHRYDEVVAEVLYRNVVAGLPVIIEVIGAELPRDEPVE